MKKITAFLLSAALVTSGCGILPEEGYDPYIIPSDFGYYRHSPMYYWPVSYTYGCRGYYGPDGSCYYYQWPYVPVQDENPADEPAIPETQPRVMATGEPWSYTSTDTLPRTMRGQTAYEPGLSNTRQLARPEPRVRSRPMTSPRPTASARPASSPPRRSPPRQAPTRIEPRTKEPERVEKMR